MSSSVRSVPMRAVRWVPSQQARRSLKRTWKQYRDAQRSRWSWVRDGWACTTIMAGVVWMIRKTLFVSKSSLRCGRTNACCRSSLVTPSCPGRSCCPRVCKDRCVTRPGHSARRFGPNRSPAGCSDYRVQAFEAREQKMIHTPRSKHTHPILQAPTQSRCASAMQATMPASRCRWSMRWKRRDIRAGLRRAKYRREQRRGTVRSQTVQQAVFCLRCCGRKAQSGHVRC